MFFLGLLVLYHVAVPSNAVPEFSAYDKYASHGACAPDDLNCYLRALEADTETTRVVALPYTKPQLYIVCSMIADLNRCATSEFCETDDKGFTGTVPVDVFDTFQMICDDYEYENGTSWACVHNPLTRAHTSLCMTHYLLNETVDCDELTWGLTCAHRVANDRCGESSAEFLHALRIRAFTTYLSTHGCSGELKNINVLGIAIGMMLIAFFFIPLAIRFTWCPPNFRTTRDIEVANKMIINWKAGM